MRKIPVGETISAAYGFAFAGFLNVLGTVWLPYLLLIVLSGGVIYLLAPDLPGHMMRGEFDPPVMFEVIHVAGVIWLISIVVRGMVTVGLQELATGRAQGPRFFYFSLGAPVWRMIGATILLILVICLIALLTILAAVVFGWAMVHFVPSFGHALAVIGGIAAALWLIYACVRLAFFLPAVVVAENQIGLGRAWELGGGNFWRIFAVMFVVIVPVAIAFGIIENAVVGSMMMSGIKPMHFQPGMSPDELMKAYADLFKPMLEQLRHVWPVFVVLAVIREVVFLGLANGAVGKAYVAVTGGTNIDGVF